MQPYIPGIIYSSSGGNSMYAPRAIAFALPWPANYIVNLLSCVVSDHQRDAPHHMLVKV